MEKGSFFKALVNFYHIESITTLKNATTCIIGALLIKPFLYVL